MNKPIAGRRTGKVYVAAVAVNLFSLTRLSVCAKFHII